MHVLPPTLSRTSSTTSISESDEPGASNPRRTRKRFSNVQLTMLEQLFHQNSHPSREERDGVAKLGGMEIKSVTIWFQNKRQTERKVALGNTTNPNTRPRSPVSSPLSGSGRSVYSTPTGTASSSRPSLDHVASRSELRAPIVPRTPTRRHIPGTALWDIMPSSPVAPPFSPPSREYVEFGKAHRTLEWACAAARLAEKDGSGARKKARGKSQGKIERVDTLDWTEDEAEEAITPPSTWSGEDRRWSTAESAKKIPDGKKGEDEDMMKAAIALCGQHFTIYIPCFKKWIIFYDILTNMNIEHPSGG